ncbi:MULTISPECIES: YihY/virulence factor BrkB family protein [unclassified Leptolyngbya]|uniref:YihY/virulence factor BrkB family protein n=1 Tax=unclassified Leptolyngbya TaxID=2650499 RepID=UPI001686EBA9|nr:MULTISPECIES: YihY/virulence factor BrkB family protein [unclassified Leptolyngbya]MBD1910913.1 YihY/virulence factor BrkB family protein [Leptolyngbya sp. FACHB-8]MBD2154958.1 YihY/virulence factor BrkB family protein [Leptolyngbya sp. FACHB-16]
MGFLEEGWRLLKATIREWHAKQISVLAASLAYYAIFSLAPLIIISVMIVGAFFGEAVAEGEIVGPIRSVIGEDGARFVEALVYNLREETSGSSNSIRWMIGVGFLLFGASGFFVQIQNALNRIWEVELEQGRQVQVFFQKRLLSFLMVLLISILVFLSVSANIVLAYFIDMLTGVSPMLESLWQPLSFLITLTIIILLMTSIYSILPDATVDWKDALVGSAITAVLFMFGQYLFGLFLRQTNFGSAYGFASTFIVLVTWIYYSAHIFLFGANLTQVYAKRLGHAIVPEENATRATNAQSS